MTSPGVFSDEDLSCYLDGEASPEKTKAIARAVHADKALNNRLDDLKAGEQAFRAALVTSLASAPAMPALEPVQSPPANIPWHIGIAGVAVGAIAAIGLSWGMLNTPQPGWQDVVASYQSLYVTETLNQIDLSPEESEAGLQRLSQILGLDLTNLPEVNGLSYKRAQQLGFNGKPLAQLTFLNDQGGPVALCIIHIGASDSTTISADVLSGLDTYSWTDNGYGILLVGPQGDNSLKDAAKVFRDALKNTKV